MDRHLDHVTAALVSTTSNPAMLMVFDDATYQQQKIIVIITKHSEYVYSKYIANIPVTTL